MIDQITRGIRSLVKPKRKAKRDLFLVMADRFSKRLAKWPLPRKPAAPRGRIGVLVTQWLSTGVPLFNLEIALMLAREGYQVTALFDETDLVGNAVDAAHDKALSSILDSLGGVIERVDVHKAPEGTPDVEAAQTLLAQNAIWRMRGEEKASEFIEANPASQERIARHIGRLEEMLRTAGFDWIFIPGGIFGLSGAYVAAARKTKTEFVTYDAAVGVLRLAQGGIAAHLGDLPRAFANLRARWQSDESEKQRVLGLAQAEIEDRAAARDFRHFQVAAATRQDDLKYDMLVPLNIRWDSAALDRQRVFTSVREWLETLLKWTAARRDTTICVRQHPRERLNFARGSDDVASLLSQFEGMRVRLRYVRADEEVNTYDLLRHCKVVLPHTSTIGIEAAFLGKPVVLGTTCYYEDLGFVWRASSQEEYFSHVDKALSGKLQINEAQRADAAFAYFLTQRCAFVRSEFNPHAENFDKWCEMTPEAVWQSPETEDVRTALLNHEPLAAVRYRRLVQG